MRRPIRILGIDPGLRRTGWGLVEVDGNRLIYVACGSVTTSDKVSLAERLVTIHDGLAKVIEEFSPDVEFAASYPRAEKYIGWPMLVVMELEKSE